MKTRILLPSRWTHLLFLVGLFGFGNPLLAQTANTETIVLPWTERKPFQYIESDGKLKGILYDLGEKVFGKAGVPLKWTQVPANRIILDLKANTERLCLVGWFKTPEREEFAKVSLPIYQDKPQRGVMRADSSIATSTTLKSIFDDRKIKVLVKQGYSYGTRIDELIATRNGENVDKVVVDHSRLLRMIAERRSDLLFLTQEELEYYSAAEASFKKEFVVVNFTDLPAGNFRHILCSKQVPDETMDQFNKAIKATIKLQ